MKSTSEVLKAMLREAKRRGLKVIEEVDRINFYETGSILVTHFPKIKNDYTMSEHEYKVYMSKILKYPVISED